MTAPLHLDPLPVEWAAHKIDEYTFASQYGPLVSDTDDDSDHPDPDDSDDDDEQGSARQDRQASSPVDNHYQTRGRDAEPADALDEEKVKRTMRKRRKQLDEINFQRLCITLAVRYRNGVHASHDALNFLGKEQPFITAWQWIHAKLRYASNCLERSSWRDFRSDYKGQLVFPAIL